MKIHKDYNSNLDIKNLGGGLSMTTMSKLEEALTSAKGLQSQLKTFSLDTEDQQAQQMFNQLSTNLENTVQMLQSRKDFVASEEPQYLQQSMGMQNQQQKQQQNQQQNKQNNASNLTNTISSNINNNKKNNNTMK